MMEHAGGRECGEEGAHWEKAIFEQRVEGAEEERSHVTHLESAFPRRGKGRRVVLRWRCLSCSKNSKEAGRSEQ